MSDDRIVVSCSHKMRTKVSMVIIDSGDSDDQYMSSKERIYKIHVFELWYKNLTEERSSQLYTQLQQL